LRLLVYNIRYALDWTGLSPAGPGAGYLRSSRRVLEEITQFIRSEDPDVVGLIEVDTGSVRTGMVNQAEYVAKSLGHYTAYQCKYGASSINKFVRSCASRATRCWPPRGGRRALSLFRYRHQAPDH